MSLRAVDQYQRISDGECFQHHSPQFHGELYGAFASRHGAGVACEHEYLAMEGSGGRDTRVQEVVGNP